MDCDFIVIGAGIAGASAAYELALAGHVVLVERESQPGYHTTGRSAAMYLETYGEAPVRALAAASRSFFFAPPEGFSESDLLSPRGVLAIAREDQLAALERETAANANVTGGVQRLEPAAACELVPVLRPDYLAAAMYLPDARGIDVHALHHGFLRGLRARGGALVTDAGVAALARRDGRWRVSTAAGDHSAPVVVNAAGAWADEIARLAGVAPIGLVPKRRTAITFDAPEGIDCSGWPMTLDADEEFYFKPESGRLMGSPADETPMPPCDVQPDEFDIAVTVDRIERATTMRVRRIEHRWAGLRSFVDDHLPVIGFDPDVEGFFWLAGQGGIGIMTSPATARLAAALATGDDISGDIAARGITAGTLSPGRLRG